MKKLSIIKLFIYLFITIHTELAYAQHDTQIEAMLDSASVLYESNPKRALDFAFAAKTESESKLNALLISRSYYSIGKIYRIMGNLIEAEKNLDSALSYRIENSTLIAEYNNEKGIILKQQSRFKEALKCYNISLSIQKINKNIKNEARAYNNIGRIYEAMEYYDEAMRYYNKAIQIYNSLPITKSKGITLQNIGSLHQAKGNADSALYYYKTALPIYEEAKNKILIAYAYTSMASVTQDKNIAIKYLNKSIKIDKEINASADLGNAYVELAKVYIKSNQHKKAIPLLKESVDLFIQNKHKNVTRDALKLLYSCYNYTGEYKKAFFYQSLYYKYQDTIKSEDNRYALLKYESELKLKDREKEIAVQQVKMNSANLKLKIEERQRIYLGLGIALLLLLLVVVINQVVKQKKNNSILNRQKLMIEKSDKEKEVLIREIHHRVKNNLQIISSLLKLEHRKSENNEVKKALSYSRQRIEAISLIHEKLYQQADLTNINLNDYLLDIAENLLFSFDKDDKILLNINSDVKSLNADIAINLGLLTAELMTNSIKHGYNSELNDFKISIELFKNEESVSFKYNDNGQGTHNSVNSNNENSFGIKLIQSIIKKLNGEIIPTQDEKKGFNLFFNFKTEKNA